MKRSSYSKSLYSPRGRAPPFKKPYKRPSKAGYVMQPETKYFDVAINAHVIATAGDWTGTEVPCDNFITNDGATVGAYTSSALNPSAVGTGYGEIIGTRYRLKKIRVKGQLHPAGAADQADVEAGRVTRLVLVMDINPDGAQAQGETIFTDFAADGANVSSYLNMGTSAGKFRVLKDIRVVHNPGTAATDHATNSSTNSNVLDTQIFSFVWAPRKPLVVTLKASASTPATAQLQNCNIFLLALTDASQVVTISAVSRTYYCE